MTLCRLRVVQANSHSISIPHLVVFVKDLSYYVVRQIARGGQVLPMAGLMNFSASLRNLKGCCVARGGTNGFLQSKNKGTKCHNDTLSEPTRNATEPRGQRATPYPR